MIIPNLWKSKSHVPYHQPENDDKQVDCGPMQIVYSAGTKIYKPKPPHVGCISPINEKNDGTDWTKTW